MTKFSTFVVVGVGVIAMMLGSPSRSTAQDNSGFETADYPLGNRIFDSWIDNRRATYGRIVPQLMVSQYSAGSGYANGVVAPLPSAPWSWNQPMMPNDRARLFAFRRR